MEYNSAITKNKWLIHQHVEEAQKHYAEQEKTDIKEYILLKSVYTTFRQKLINSVKIQKTGCLWRVELIEKNPEGTFWEW